MNFRQFYTTALVAFSVCFSGSLPGFAQDDLSQVEIQTIPIRNGVYLLVGEGGNIGVSAGSDGVFLVDDQFAPLTAKIEAAIAQITTQPIRFLINTHWHFDHTGGNENLGKAGVVILAHDNVRRSMSMDQFIEALNREIPAAPAVALPVITFNDRVTFHLNGDTIQAIHMEAAHTDGDTVLYWQNADVIHTGDLFFNGFYPFIDIQNGGSITGMIAGVDQLLDLASDHTQIIPGHGPLSNRTELLTYRQMLVAVQGRTAAAIALDMTLEEFLASNPTAELDPEWGDGFLSPEQFLTIVYQDLARSKPQ